MLSHSMKGDNIMYNDYSAARMRTRAACNINAAPSHSSAPAKEKATWGLAGYPLASVFAPLQNFCELYDLETALARGTAFSELDLPFVCGDTAKGGGCCRG